MCYDRSIIIIMNNWNINLWNDFIYTQSYRKLKIKYRLSIVFTFLWIIGCLFGLGFLTFWSFHSFYHELWGVLLLVFPIIVFFILPYVTEYLQAKGISINGFDYYKKKFITLFFEYLNIINQNYIYLQQRQNPVYQIVEKYKQKLNKLNITHISYFQCLPFFTYKIWNIEVDFSNIIMYSQNKGAYKYDQDFLLFAIHKNQLKKIENFTFSSKDIDFIKNINAKAGISNISYEQHINDIAPWIGKCIENLYINITSIANFEVVLEDEYLFIKIWQFPKSFKLNRAFMHIMGLSLTNDDTYKQLNTIFAQVNKFVNDISDYKE